MSRGTIEAYEPPEYEPFRRRLADVLIGMQRRPNNWNAPSKWKVRSRRLFAYYVLRELPAAIAGFEGCSPSSVRASIESAEDRLAWAVAADLFDVEELAFVPSLKVSVTNRANRLRADWADRAAKKATQAPKQ